VPSPDSPHRTIRIPAEPAQLAGLRRELRTWLGGHHVDDAVVSDVLVAVTEAASNAIEHGYGHDDARTVVVEGYLGAELHVTVRDRGRWTGQVHSAERGRGLPLMQGVMDAVEVERSDQGTIVRMRRSLDA